MQSPGVECLASGKKNGIVAVPSCVHVRAVGHEQFHHRNSLAIECGAHQGCIASLIDVRSILDHPSRDGQTGPVRWYSRHSALGDPRERSLLGIAQWSLMQRRISRHHGLDKGKIVTVDRIFKLSSFFQRVHVCFEFRPTGEAILTSHLKLSMGERSSVARL